MIPLKMLASRMDHNNSGGRSRPTKLVPSNTTTLDLLHLADVCCRSAMPSSGPDSVLQWWS